MPKHYNHTGMAEWSYLLDIDDIGAEPKTYMFEADERERVDLARRMGVVSVEKAQASVTVQRVSGGIIHAIGSVRANLTQSCVVSLGPVPAHAEDEFEGWFGDKRAVSFAKARNEREAKKAHAEVEILEESVDPEPVVNGKIDVGELATQYLSLALDPYPRAEGVSSQYITPEGAERDKEGAELRRNPFEALKDWKEKR